MNTLTLPGYQISTSISDGFNTAFTEGLEHQTTSHHQNPQSRISHPRTNYPLKKRI